MSCNLLISVLLSLTMTIQCHGESPPVRIPFGIPYKEIEGFPGYEWNSPDDFFEYVMDDNVRIDFRLAAINNIALRCRHHVHIPQKIKEYMQERLVADGVALAAHYSAEMKSCLAYIMALDDDADLDRSISLAFSASRDKPESYSIAYVYLILSAQKICNCGIAGERMHVLVERLQSLDLCTQDDFLPCSKDMVIDALFGKEYGCHK